MQCSNECGVQLNMYLNMFKSSTYEFWNRNSFQSFNETQAIYHPREPTTWNAIPTLRPFSAGLYTTKTVSNDERPDISETGRCEAM